MRGYSGPDTFVSREPLDLDTTPWLSWRQAVTLGEAVRGTKYLISGIALLLCSAAEARPSAFIRGNPSLAWYIAPMDVRLLGKNAGSTTAEQLSKYIKETREYYSYDVCSLEAVHPDTYVGIDKAAQLEIDSSQKHAVWRINSATPDGRRISAQSILFEGCETDDPRGAALLVNDSVTGEILAFQPLGSYGEGDTSYPAWVLFLWSKEGDEIFSYSGCMECGSRTRVYYDVTRKKIYTEYNGH
jgi:hypothetical protein